MKILIADDDPQILRALRITLGSLGYAIATAADGAEAIRLAVEGAPDLIMLDVSMPHLDGIAVIQAVRGWSDMPILVVSGLVGSADKVGALDAGADDYVTKPFAMDELLARIRALTRRIAADSADDEPVVAFGGITVDLSTHQVTRDGDRTVIRLTPTEWKILGLLVRHPGRLVTHQELLTEVWGTHQVRETGYLRLYIGQLRKKLEPVPAHPRHFLTEAGMGYRFAPEPA